MRGPSETKEVRGVALPVRHPDSSVDRGRGDLFADLDRLNRQLSSYLDSWRQFPDALADAFDQSTSTGRPRASRPAWTSVSSGVNGWNFAARMSR